MARFASDAQTGEVAIRVDERRVVPANPAGRFLPHLLGLSGNIVRYLAPSGGGGGGGALK